MTTRIALLAGTALTALALVGTSAAMSHPKLTGDVGPGFTIHLKKAGKTVTSLTKGTYTITVTDKSAIHNFHLTGPGVNKEITGVGFQGTKTVTLTFKKGTYKYVCDPHASLMKGSFKVT
jgi:plastocyanin